MRNVSKPLTEGKTRGSIKNIGPSSPTKPPPPPGRWLRENDIGPYCPQCGSSMKMKYIFIRTEKCIQPQCENYEK